MKDSAAVMPASQPKYVGFANHLRRQIEDGTLQPGDRLPSRAEIRKRHNITQPTIERAQAILEREGLLVSRERQGVFVADPRETQGAPGASRVASGTLGVLSVHRDAVKPGHHQSGWSDYIIQGALDACNEAKQHTLFLQPARLQDEELAQLLRHPPSGFAFPWISPESEGDLPRAILQAVAQSGQPVVVFGSVTDYAEFDRVASDHDAGCYELTRHLIERGCRRILPFWPPVSAGRGWLRERLTGYRRAMREADLEPLAVREISDEAFAAPSDDARAGFERTARYKAGHLADLLTGAAPPDAILEVSDGGVAATAAACRLLGRQPNVDVLIAGYDNIWRDLPHLAFEPTRPIATVDKQNWRLGRELVRLLMRRINGELESGPQLQLVAPKLIPLDAEEANASSAPW